MNEQIAVFGLGKLGCTTAACFAARGWKVVGYDVLQETVDRINQGCSPIYEPGVAELIQQAGSNIRATTNPEEALVDSDVVYIIVPTPSQKDGSFSTQFVERAILEIGRFMKSAEEDKYRVIVVTSTVLPGDMARIQKLLEDTSEKQCGKDFGLCYNPDFIALGSIIQNFTNPDMIIIGESDEKAGSILEQSHRKLVDNNPPIHRMNFYNAELCKISLNSYCTMKITFANVLAEICESMPGGDAHVIARALGTDTRISPKYLRPGLSYGGPCLPPNAMVQTEQGLKRIDQIKRGEKVLTHTGVFRKVTQTFFRDYTGDLVRVESMGSPRNPLYLTPEHPVWSRKRIQATENRYKVVKTTGKRRMGPAKGFGETKFIEAGDLQNGDVMSYPRIKIKEKIPEAIHFKTHHLSPVPPKLQMNPELMRLFGFYVSEGSTWRKDIKFSLHKKEIKYARWILSTFKKHFGLCGRVKRHGENGINVLITGANVAPYFRNTFGHFAASKRIPWEWLYLPEEYFVELLRGLWYGDGSNSDGAFTYGTISAELARFVQLGLMRFGIPHTLQYQEERVDKRGTVHQKAYFIRVQNGLFYEKMNEILPDLSLSPSKGSKLTWSTEDSINYTIRTVGLEYYSGLVYNLEVAVDNSYVLDNGTVHNCFPRDDRAFTHTAMKFGVRHTLAEKTDQINDFHKIHRVPQKIFSLLQEVKSTTVSILGTTYKENTTLVEESPAIEVARQLSRRDIKVKVYDPSGMEETRKILDGSPSPQIEFCDSAEICIRGSGVCFIATPWEEFTKMKASFFIENMTTPVVLDAWGICRDTTGLIYRQIGKSDRDGK